MSAIRILSTDSTFVDDLRAALGSLDADGPVALDALLADGPGGTVFVDGAFDDGCTAFEASRRLTVRGGTRLVFVLPHRGVDAGVAISEPIARFCGASSVLTRDFDADTVAAAIGAAQSSPIRPNEFAAGDAMLPEALLRELTEQESRPMELLERLADPETSLFTYEFLTYKVDEEFKRSRRFGHPLACVLMSFDGEAHEDVLRQLASVFLQACRDTDILGRFDRSSFLFLLPNTPPEGARIMAERVRESVKQLGLRDLVGDPIELAIGSAFYPHPDVQRPSDLVHAARTEAAV